MPTSSLRRACALFATQLLLWALVSELNHLLAVVHVHVFVGALFVAFTALTQPLRSGITASLLAGLMCDANEPVRFGTHALLFAIVHLSLFRIRDRVPRDDATSAIIVVLLANLALFIVFSFLHIHTLPSPAAAWRRLVADLLCSQVLLAAITPWYFALQDRALVLARAPRAEAA